MKIVGEIYGVYVLANGGENGIERHTHITGYYSAQ
jgi:hypothetical protein